MLGAIIGDIVGSRFEHQNIKSKEFALFGRQCRPTDDSTMTLAIAHAILACDGNYSKLTDRTVLYMQDMGRRYPDVGYSRTFTKWLKEKDPLPYGGRTNGAAMRVSPCAYAGNTLEEAKKLSKIVTEVSHNHPEGIKGAEATTVAIFMALHGSSKDEIRTAMEAHYYKYKLNFRLDEIRPTYEFDSTCQGSVPQAIEAFLESTSFEDAIRNAISIGGDSDTIAAIAGSIAEAYYGIPENIRSLAVLYLDQIQLDVLDRFERKYGIFREFDTLNVDHSESKVKQGNPKA